MCGVSGVFSFKGKNFNKEVSSMNACQFSRGPDDEGLDSSNGITFGHNRLSILDLTDAGHQPMKFNDLIITYNGEVYNFKEIQAELKKYGYEFHSETDTEVILKGYDKWGIDVIEKLRGMFAFGLWDSEKQKLFLVRDRFGIKPLYYYKSEDNIVFSSTVKALSENQLVPDEKEKKAWIGFFLLGSVPSPYTTIKDTFSVKPGHYLEINKDGKVEDRKYYNLLNHFKNKTSIDFDEAVSNTKDLLHESVKYRLISDAPLGVFLSGGLDSSSLSAIAADLRDDPITTLSVYFDEESYSERDYQEMISKKINSDHNRKKVSKDDFINNLDDALEAMDQPTVDGINTYFVSHAAKESGLKTVLSGLGSDEIFAGYSSFRKIIFLRKIQKLPKAIKLPLKLTKFLSGKLAKLSYLYEDDPFYLYLAVRGLFTPNRVSNILDIDIKEVNDFIKEISKQYPSPSNLSSVDLLSYFELKFYIHNQLLKDSDFMAMHHSVEVRVPFLDHKLVEYVSSLPSKFKLKGKFNKTILVRVVEDLIPEKIYNRTKMGFTFPFQKWLKEEHGFSGHWSRYWSNFIYKTFNKK